jgi:methyl-accepting chemotaxis protein
MVEQIREACSSQVDSSALISASVNNIEGTTAANSHATKVMNAAVADLTHQIDLLEKEMTGFKI